MTTAKSLALTRIARGILTILFLLIISHALAATAAQIFTYVTIPATNNIQTAMYSTFPTGTFTANNALATPFSIPSAPGKCGLSGALPCNYYDGFGAAGNGKSITMNVSVANPTDVYTLMNAYSPTPGRQLATIKFVGTGGASVTFALIAGQNIRDYLQGAFANARTNGVAGMLALNAFTCILPTNCTNQSGRPGAFVADEQDFSLGPAFAGQTLTQIIITDTDNGPNPILLGITVGSPNPTTPAITGIVSASAFGGLASVAPGSWIEIHGSNLASDSRGWNTGDFSDVNAPTVLDGTSVAIGGQAAFIDFISSSQINAQVPPGVGQQQVIVTSPSGVSAQYPITISPTAPGLLAPSSLVAGGLQYVEALFADSLTPVFTPGDITSSFLPRARPGDTIILYGIGFGPVTPDRAYRKYRNE